MDDALGGHLNQQRIDPATMIAYDHRPLVWADRQGSADRCPPEKLVHRQIDEIPNRLRQGIVRTAHGAPNPEGEGTRQRQQDHEHCHDYLFGHDSLLSDPSGRAQAQEPVFRV
jgi:hypothetical protein